MTPSCQSGDSPALPPQPRRARRLALRFLRAREGATAVEFAFVSVPFFALLFAIIETALVFWTTQALETAVADAARQIYTGQFEELHGGSADEIRVEAFRDLICGRVVALFDCRGTLKVTVEQAGADGFGTTFGALLNDDGDLDPDDSRIGTTESGRIVIVRAATLYPMFFMESFQPLLAGGEARPRSKGRLIVATAAFRNEPF